MPKQPCRAMTLVPNSTREKCQLHIESQCFALIYLVFYLFFSANVVSSPAVGFWIWGSSLDPGQRVPTRKCLSMATWDPNYTVTLRWSVGSRPCNGQSKVMQGCLKPNRGHSETTSLFDLNFFSSSICCTCGPIFINDKIAVMWLITLVPSCFMVIALHCRTVVTAHTRGNCSNNLCALHYNLCALYFFCQWKLSPGQRLRCFTCISPYNYTDCTCKVDLIYICNVCALIQFICK